ncbi:arf-GAP domain and FG repeat-containing protein 1 isoform X1 [Rhipicephalus sanguineus]|uniref:arf-GAP domain and FG repeat-containing protein 1 isoform X1 n=1 Tax=Rhipicephalus sanguineus TaxID=34632 RepID=UPI001893A3F5|nr:arf-GAP domain and FG repeat-containing protein 1 isoform X1 [Rhipicephalus sanguineus]
MAARKRTQEEKNLKTLRELAALPANKQCFDCHQRGPTYINMTVGSFVCTSCSGILRGLNPPHRVKSITMTTFTPEEIEQIKNKGNEYCKYVWLGLYDSRCPMEPDSRDEQRTRDMMIQKYERKRWYVEPEVALQRMHADQQQQGRAQQQQQPQQQPTPPPPTNHVPHSNSAVMPDTKPLSSLLGKNSLPLVIHKSQPTTPSSATWPTPISSAVATTTTSQPMFKSNVDIFGTFNSDPFSSASVNSTPTVPAKPATFSANGNFANFDTVFSSGNQEQAPVVAHTGVTNSINSNHIGDTSGGGGFVASFPPMPSALSAVSTPSTVTLSAAAGGGEPQTKVPPADRYAALADLDNLFHQESPQPQPPLQPPQPPAYPQASAFAVPQAAAATPSNPFAAAAPVWNMAAPAQSASTASAFATPNPFEAVAPTGGVFGGLDGMGGAGSVGAGASVFGGSPNGYALAGTPPVVQQKGIGYVGWGNSGLAAAPGGIVTPAVAPSAWPAMGKAAGPMATDWSQVGSPAAANPFLSGPMPRANSSNPFL